MYIAIIYRGRERREGREGGRGYGEREKGGREGGDTGRERKEGGRAAIMVILKMRLM